MTTENKSRHKDSQGRLLEIDQVVAYNMSGNVVPGQIVGFSPGHIKVWYRGPSKYWEDHVSQVRNGRSMLILPPENPQ